MDSLFLILISVVRKYWIKWTRNENTLLIYRYMNERKIPRPKPLTYFPQPLYLSEKRGGKICRVILVRIKSDESNILQLAIHLFSNRPTYYLLFD
ncbi:hypothetical protein RchiOBHm_CPg0502221 (chloroplast) [Rosa chinensis]|uniref:Uncharacterized protein n=1 Tax=Rosa chinensis TaxID=74649 RepID=A0A2P6P1A1_ROSCH|nr:hypothetical protein RchiOBHm_CPg0502221 [Rosa chinensis]